MLRRHGVRDDPSNLNHREHTYTRAHIVLLSECPKRGGGGRQERGGDKEDRRRGGEGREKKGVRRRGQGGQEGRGRGGQEDRRWRRRGGEGRTKEEDEREGTNEKGECGCGQEGASRRGEVLHFRAIEPACG